MVNSRRGLNGRFMSILSLCYRAAPEHVSEIAEAVQNYISIVHYTRNYSFEALAIARSFHDSGWLLGVVSSEKEQLELLESLFDKMLSRNAQRARTSLPPMTHEQVSEPCGVSVGECLL